MKGRVRAVSGHLDVSITQGWELASTSPGSVSDPAAFEHIAVDWLATTAPATAASALRAAGLWSLDSPARRFDADDWWWRVRFAGSVAGESDARDEVVLCLDGIATLADVWLNGEPIAQLDNMFASHRVPVTLAVENLLVIRCRSLDQALAVKRPRPRWRAPMVEHSQLRWQRTTLLGRTPGWSPPAAAVGPWRPVRIERRRGVTIDDVYLRARLDGNDGVVDVSATVRDLGAGFDSVTLVLTRDGREYVSTLRRDGDRVNGSVSVPNAVRWWPHTHGDPALYHVRLEVHGAAPVTADLGPLGFREIAADLAADGFALGVNGVRVFCRGACWTPLDPVTLSADRAAYASAFAQVKAAGMNMLRISGAMVYESDDFFDAADAAGVLIWQDLMFANMDYPEEDATFMDSVTREVRQQLACLVARPSLAVVCGNSEGEQQAAMWGASRERWSPRLFHETLAALSREILPDVPYWPSSAHGGAFPHQADRGTTSYYGVGAYLRPLDDARRADVRFATECLGFAHVPAALTFGRMQGGAAVKVHHPGWKARTPRDLGAGWDFDDVRDHYLNRCFGVDPLALRYADHDRYLALGRAVTGEVMAQVFGEWRSSRSRCAGGLVWFLRDLWPGAGFGVVGSDGVPKAAYRYLARALAPVALHVSDEGVNGVVIHAMNDRAVPIEGELQVALYLGETMVCQSRRSMTVPPRSSVEASVVSLFDGFMDVGHSYRFGPPIADLMAVTLRAAGEVLAEAFHFPLGLPSRRERDLGLTACLTPQDGGELDLLVATRAFAQSLSIDIQGFVPDDDFFHLAPGNTRSVRLRPGSETTRSADRLRGTLTALNGDSSILLQVPRCLFARNL